ncbi:hypothetical protein ABLN73_03990 [Mycobacterium tuberculosis]
MATHTHTRLFSFFFFFFKCVCVCVCVCKKKKKKKMCVCRQVVRCGLSIDGERVRQDDRVAVFRASGGLLPKAERT